MVVSCPGCGKKTALLNNVCEHCGIKVKKCIECGNIMKESQTICDYCGYSFEQTKEKEVEQTKETGISKELRKTAVDLIAFAQSENKKYNRLGKVFGSFGFVFFILIMAICALHDKLFENANSLSSVASTVFICKIILVLSGILFILSLLFKEFRGLFSVGAISRQIDAKKFDYNSYYKHPSIGKKIFASIDFEDWGDIQLINAIRYKTDPSTKTTKLILALVQLICRIIACLCVYIALEPLWLEIMVGFSFGNGLGNEVVVPLIVAVVFFVAEFIVNTFLDKDLNIALKWMREQQKEQD